jgi:hypothetical protein
MWSKGFVTDGDKSMIGRVRRRKSGGKRKRSGAYDCSKGIFSSLIKVRNLTNHLFRAYRERI